MYGGVQAVRCRQAASPAVRAARPGEIHLDGLGWQHVYAWPDEESFVVSAPAWTVAPWVIDTYLSLFHDFPAKMVQRLGPPPTAVHAIPARLT